LTDVLTRIAGLPFLSRRYVSHVGAHRAPGKLLHVPNRLSTHIEAFAMPPTTVALTTVRASPFDIGSE
jgi:hypothetical protein